EPMILASVFLLGLFVCLSFKPRWWLGMVLVSLFGLFHGQAHGSEIPMAASGIVYGLGFIAASLALHGLGWGAGVLLGNARFHSPKILLRLAGLPVLAGGALLAAL
ncbi:MAG: HupE/UreJ family protein, partial [Spirochaetia bacterium]|nr:HupE/UreJ family protein [Spirochaetia bacterium]